MNVNEILFKDVTLLVTHYNRVKSLERLLGSFQALNIYFEDIVVSDDGSKPENVAYLQQMQIKFNFRLITTPINKGLGNNINKGQDAVQTQFTLYVQEDFEPKAIFSEHFIDALDFFKSDKDIDIARFYAYFKYPYLKPYGKGFAEMVFKPQLWANNHLKFYAYSDHPHLRRTSFFEKFGRYPEGLKGDITEYQMAISFLQNNGKGIFYEQFNDLFYQKNSPDEPSTMGRASWRESKNIFALAIRVVYLQFKLLKWTRDYYYKFKNGTK